jgi:hypothetical protein
MAWLLQDIRYGARLLVRSPSMTAVVVLSLALGIGANTTIFTLVNAVLLSPLPVRDAARLVRVVTTEVRNGAVTPHGAISRPNALDLRDRNTVLRGCGRLLPGGAGERRRTRAGVRAAGDRQLLTSLACLVASPSRRNGGPSRLRDRRRFRGTATLGGPTPGADDDVSRGAHAGPLDFFAARVSTRKSRSCPRRSSRLRPTCRPSARARRGIPTTSRSLTARSMTEGTFAPAFQQQLRAGWHGAGEWPVPPIAC